MLVRVAILIMATPAVAQPVFTPVEVPVHQYTGGWEHFVGGGVAVLDCNQDMLPDLFVAGGESPALLLKNTTRTRGGPLGFTKADLPEITNTIGAYPLDIDSDGFMDLAVLRVGENLLLKGGPDCTFTPFSGLGFASGEHWTTAFSATWEGGNALPTMAFGNYVDRANPDGPFGTCESNFLYRPEGGNYGQPEALDPGYCALSMLFTDWGQNGRADLRVSNDRHYYPAGGAEQLWAMEPQPRLYSEAEGWRPYHLWGMGIASRDLDGDGRAEVFLSSMGDQHLQTLEAGNTPSYADATYARGTTAHRPYTGEDGRPSTGWHIAFGDAQNDGLDDVFIAKGNVQEMPGLAMQDPNNLLLQQPDGRFTEAGLAAGLADMARARGAAFEDLNLDGLPDIVVVNRNAPLRVYQNQTKPAGHWLLLDLQQPAPNANAIGAFIEITDGHRIWTREITAGGGHASGSAVMQHFGLGGAEAVSIRVRLPNEAQSDWQEVGTDQILRINASGGVLEIEVL
ncbi:MAG TPA: CRTAC1 family protein [Rhodobacteraceae bacterium]|nr:CRTAC1 family protein [Paracoccaceae bacterium]